MDEMLEMYKKIPYTLSRVIDIETLVNADNVLSQIEEIHPELLRVGVEYLGFISDAEDEKLNICVVGADGHFLVTLLRMAYPDSNTIWEPNTGHIFYGEEVKFHGVILSAMAVEEYINSMSEIDVISKFLCENGFVISNTQSGLHSGYYDMLNRCNLVPFKLSPDGTIMYSIYKKVGNISNRQFKSSEQYRKFKYNMVYCVCPALVKSGGPELMHQLVHCINSMGGNAMIAYADTNSNGGFVNPEYREYVAGHVTALEEIDDIKGNAVVIPEGWPSVTRSIRNAEVLFWWLSVDNFKIVCKTEKEIDNMIDYLKNKVSVHMVQSEYARRYIESKGIRDDDIVYLSDYINNIYTDKTDMDELLDINNRKDIVLYNPKKGYEFVKKLIEIAPDIDFKPIENMTTSQVRELMYTSKVYIDFGNHPGKDRIPREAASCGLIVITGRKGSAAYTEDVPIPEKYKIDESACRYEDAVSSIRNCLKDYERIVHEYNEYRAFISAEKERFEEDVLKAFFES